MRNLPLIGFILITMGLYITISCLSGDYNIPKCPGGNCEDLEEIPKVADENSPYGPGSDNAVNVENNGNGEVPASDEGGFMIFPDDQAVDLEAGKPQPTTTTGTATTTGTSTGTGGTGTSTGTGGTGTSTGTGGTGCTETGEDCTCPVDASASTGWHILSGKAPSGCPVSCVNNANDIIGIFIADSPTGFDNTIVVAAGTVANSYDYHNNAFHILYVDCSGSLIKEFYFDTSCGGALCSGCVCDATTGTAPFPQNGVEYFLSPLDVGGGQTVYLAGVAIPKSMLSTNPGTFAVTVYDISTGSMNLIDSSNEDGTKADTDNDGLYDNIYVYAGTW